MLLIIDNYDSFTFNLVHYFQELGAQTRVVRNDAMSAAEAISSGADGIVISPGPGRPADAGICPEIIRSAPDTLPVLGVCLGDAVVVNARTGDGEIMGLRHRNRPLHGVQFHPESIASQFGHDLLANFLTVCGLKPRAAA